MRAILQNLHGVRDLSRLFAFLGYVPDGRPAEGGTTVVARWRGFDVVATAACDSPHDLRRTAQRVGRRGGRALLVALRPGIDLAIAAPRIGTAGATRALVVSLHDPPALLLQRVEELRPKPAECALALSLRVAELLDAETAAERFFSAFRSMLERMTASLEGRHAERDRRLAALLSLSRILFLYFVQARGWLDGRPDYLRSLLDTTLGQRRHFHRTALAPLFFGTLNRPVTDRAPGLSLGMIPYLNGGLFEPHAVERRLGPIAFPNALWRDAFDHVFERFRFCLRENDDADAVAPDMLGRVFERLMDGDERHDSGTYYTPERVVQAIVDAAIETALAGIGRLGTRTARRVVRCETVPPAAARRARAALRRLRLLDPAVGSGAFLLSALESLTDMRLALESDDVASNRCALKRSIVRRNLFGVDLNPVAVRLAELRLWLAIVADDRTRDIRGVAPLPNLDGIIRQGDSLLDPIGAVARLQDGAFPPSCREAVATVRAARWALFDRRGAARRDCLRELRDAEGKLAARVIESAERRSHDALAELTTLARAPDLFGRRSGLNRSQRTRVQVLMQRRKELRRLRQHVEDGASPGFSFESHVPDVMATGGFTVVVGNPPWVRAERLPGGYRHALHERYSWWRTGGARGFAHQPDLAVAFLERSVKLAAPGGAIGLLLPSKITTAGYGETARAHLVREVTVRYLHRVSEPEARGFGATIYPLALVARRSPPPRDHRIRLGFDAKEGVTQQSLTGPGPWILVPDRSRDAVEAFRASAPGLGEIAPPALGAKTGADAILVGRALRSDGVVATVRFADGEVLIEEDVLRPALRGRDVAPFTARPVRVVLWGLDQTGRPLATLPPLARRYVRRHAARLRRRTDFRRGPPWTVFRTRAATTQHRVVWPDLARRPRAVLLEETAPEAIPLNTCYVAPAPDRETGLVIAAVLNSTWSRATVWVSADEARGGYRRINARAVARLPVPGRKDGRGALAELSAVAHRRAVPQDELDDAVAAALDLSARTRRALSALVRDHVG